MMTRSTLERRTSRLESKNANSAIIEYYVAPSGWAGKRDRRIFPPPDKSKKLLFRRKFIDRLGTEFLAGPQYRCRKIRVIGRIRIVLRLQANGAELGIRHSALSLHRFVEMNRGIELNARFGSQNFHL